MNIYRTLLLIFLAITVAHAAPVTPTNWLSNAEALKTNSATTSTSDGSTEEQAENDEKSRGSILSPEGDSNTPPVASMTAIIPEEVMTSGPITAEYTAQTTTSNGLEMTEVSTVRVTNESASYGTLPFSGSTGSYVEPTFSSEFTALNTDDSGESTHITGLSTTEISGRINPPVKLMSELSSGQLIGSEASHLSVGYTTATPAEAAIASSFHQDIKLLGAPAFPNIGSAITPPEIAQPNSIQSDRESGPSLDTATNALATDLSEEKPDETLDVRVNASPMYTSSPTKETSSERSDTPGVHDTGLDSDSIKSSGSDKTAPGSESISNGESALLTSAIEPTKIASRKSSELLESSQTHALDRKTFDYPQEIKKQDAVASGNVDGQSQNGLQNKHPKEGNIMQHGEQHENDKNERVNTKELVQSSKGEEKNVRKAMDDEDDEEVGGDKRDDSDNED